MKTTKLALSLVMASLVLPACGSKKKSKKSAPNRVVMFVHGDPMRMIEGATRNQVSFLTADNFKSFDGYHIASLNFILEREEQYNPSSFDEVEDENSTSDNADGASEFNQPTYSFVESGDRVVYTPDVVNAGLPSLGFIKNNGLLELTDYDGDPVNMEHYSLKKDGKAFSVLMSFHHSKYGKGLITMAFADSSNVKPIMVKSEDYNYLFGHFPLKWEREIEVDLCGNANAMQQDSVQKSVEAWYADPLRLTDESFRGVRYGVRTQYAPFSDLNEHCIFLVSKFKAENSTNFVTTGVTFPIINFASKEQIGSDIFIFMDHVGRELLGLPSPTTIHEMGHFFGLGHEFEEEGHDHYLSVMGYSDGSDTVTTGDFKAIRSLYGESLGDQQDLQ